MDILSSPTNTYQQPDTSVISREWRVRGLRGATTVSQNTAEATAEAVDELLDTLEANNLLDPKEIISVIFSATPDLDTVFPAAIARRRPGWEQIPLLDVQQMQVSSGLKRCIRVLIYFNTPLPQDALRPVYLRQAAQLRPDLAVLG